MSSTVLMLPVQGLGVSEPFISRFSAASAQGELAQDSLRAETFSS